MNRDGVAYAGVLYVDGRGVCDDGLWDDGKGTSDIKKNGMICTLCVMHLHVRSTKRTGPLFMFILF